MIMNNKWLKWLGMIVLAVALMVATGLVSWRTVAPTGQLISPLAGIVAVAMTVALGVTTGLVTALLGGGALLLLQSADVSLLINFLLLTLIMGWLIGWRIPLSRRLTHQQLIWLGIAAGIGELVLTLVLTALTGLISDGHWLAFVELNWLPTLLTALCDAVLVGPVTAVLRWLGRQILPPDHLEHQPKGPVEINLSKKKKDKK